MKYDFKADVRTLDYWKLSMYNTYHSMVGVANLVFFAAMILLCYKFFYEVGYGMQTLMFIGLLLIPVIHPFGIYIKAKAQVMASPRDLLLHFNDSGMTVNLGEKSETIRYNKILGVSERAGMVIIYSDGNHGYILTSRALGSDRKKFLEDLKAKLKGK